MKYADSLEKSTEFLRLAIQYMTKQECALHPISYAIWYEYASGHNAALRNAIDPLLANGQVLNEKSTLEFFQRYIAEIDEKTAERITNGFQKIMADISLSAAQAGDEAEKFGSALEHWSDHAQTSGPSDITELLTHTRKMQDSVGHLRSRLSASQREIEQLRDEVRRARDEALSDGLTGLVNRKGFDMALAACLEQSESVGPSLLITDIDHFKRINDTYGHLFGDKVIQSIAKILKENVKGRDTAARFGGEEFVILLPETPLNGAHQLAEKIRTTVERITIKRPGHPEPISNITVSLGVANYLPGESIHEFLSRADTALYNSKNSGRNRVSIATA